MSFAKAIRFEALSMGQGRRDSCSRSNASTAWRPIVRINISFLARGSVNKAVVVTWDGLTSVGWATHPPPIEGPAGALAAYEQLKPVYRRHGGEVNQTCSCRRGLFYF